MSQLSEDDTAYEIIGGRTASEGLQNFLPRSPTGEGRRRQKHAVPRRQGVGGEGKLSLSKNFVPDRGSFNSMTKFWNCL